MLTIERVDSADKRQVKRFIALPYRLYRDCPQWVPPFRIDIQQLTTKTKHPFYEHSAADFFLALRDGRVVGRIAAAENVNYNRQHARRTAQFYFFECEDDAEAAAALFARVFEWARARRLDTVIGPKGFSPFDGYGLLERGFEWRQMMNMTNYNFPYYLRLVEQAGFTKEVDFISHWVADTATFRLPERVQRIAARARERQKLHVVQFRSKGDMRRWATRIGRAYNRTFVDNWEYVPLTDGEIKFVLDNLLMVANPRLIKIVAHGDDVVGFLFGFPDLSAAMQRHNGRLLPFGVVDLLLEMRRATVLSANGMGILPAFQGLGGNALLYAELEKTMREFGFDSAEMTQVAETAVQMRHDLQTLGGEPYKNHRVFTRAL